MAQERLQKILAHAGAASRRAAEELILAGRVTVNGRVVSELGAKADPERDRIELDGRRLLAEELVYYVLHKPRSMVTTLSDPEGRPTIAELLEDVPARVYPVGRLDFHTSGALLVTNDGALADALLHPKRGVKKTYVAKLDQVADTKQIAALRNGVVLDDGYRTQPASVVVLRDEDGHGWLEITISEGKNRQIHRMAEAVGLRVMRLVRTRFAGLDTEGLRPGQIRALSNEEVDQLKFTYLGVAPSEARERERPQGARGRDRGERVRPGERGERVRPAERGERVRPAEQSERARVRGPAESGRVRPFAEARERADERSDRPRAERVRPNERSERPRDDRGRSERSERPRDDRERATFRSERPREARRPSERAESSRFERVRPRERSERDRDDRSEPAERRFDRTARERPEERSERPRAERVRPRSREEGREASDRPRTNAGKGSTRADREERRETPRQDRGSRDRRESSAEKRTTRDEKPRNRR